LVMTRAMVGFGIGMGFLIVSMYIAEVAPTEMRGQLTALEEVFLNVGIVAGYAVKWLLLGTQNDWRWMLSFGSILPLLVLLTLFCPCVHESPRWLFMKGRVEEAEKALTVFVGREEAQRAIHAMSSQAKEGVEEFATWQNLFSSYGDRQVRRSLLAGVIVASGQMLCGYLVLVLYSSTVLKTTMSEHAAFLGTVAMGVVKLAVVVIVLLILERVGRKPMLLASAAVCGISCVWLAVAFQNNASGLVLIFGFMLFMAGFSLGLGPMSFVYLSEVFPTKWRAKCMATALFSSRIFGSSFLFIFPMLVDEVGVPASFGLLAFVNAVVFVLILTFVIDTHGKTLEEIATLYSDAGIEHAKP